jgi:hypothetical protein
MSDNLQQPREFDAVLGGSIPTPLNAVVLGGIEGVRSRLQCSNVEVNGIGYVVTAYIADSSLWIDNFRKRR